MSYKSAYTGAQIDAAVPVTTTWVPALTFATPGDLSVGYTTQKGTYTKIGNRVILDFQIVTSSFTYTTASGFLQVTGLPFPSANDSGSPCVGPIYWQTFLFASGHTSALANIDPNVSLVNFFASGSNVAQRNVTTTNAVSGSAIKITGSIIYRV